MGFGQEYKYEWESRSRQVVHVMRLVMLRCGVAEARRYPDRLRNAAAGLLREVSREQLSTYNDKLVIRVQISEQG